jgi:hypothetical protein
MTGRTAAAAAVSLALGLGSAGCLSFYEIPVEIPIQAKIDVSSFQRVLVAGFLAGGSKAIDPNTETARLLRSQLRTKSDLKVIDSDPISLADEVDRQKQPDAGAGAPAPKPATDDPRIKNDKDLQNYEQIFADANYWKKLGEEYQSPLIVTGSVLFTEITKSGMVSKPQAYVDSMGVTRYQEVRQWSDEKGFALESKFVFIDGRTGAQLYSETFNEETLYPTSQNTPALSSYFELMDKVLPSFLNTLSTQKIKGTRTLIK